MIQNTACNDNNTQGPITKHNVDGAVHHHQNRRDGCKSRENLQHASSPKPLHISTTGGTNDQSIASCHALAGNTIAKSGAQVQPSNLTPHRVVIDESRKEATIEFRSTVIDHQSFRLPLPHSQLSHALKTLRLHDDRASRNRCPPSHPPTDNSYIQCSAKCQPTIHFPSPSTVQRDTDASQDLVWRRLLEANVGNYIHMNTLHGPRYGRISGLNVGENISTIILDENGSIGIHVFESDYPPPSTIYTSPSTVPTVVPHAVPRAISSAIVQTYGHGLGEFTVSYTVPSLSVDGFCFTHRLFVPATTNRDVTVHNVRCSSSALIANPFDFELRDVQLCLVVSEKQRFNNEEDSSTDSSSSSSSEQEVVSSNHEADVLNIDDLSIDSISTTALSASTFRDRVVYEVSQPVSMGTGEAMEVWLFDIMVTVRICHLFEYFKNKKGNYFRQIVRLTNDTKQVLGIGFVQMFFADKSDLKMFYFPSPFTTTFGNFSVSQPSISVTSEEKIERIANGTTCIVRDGRLIIRLLLGRTLRFHVHNKLSYSVDASIEFRSAVHSGETGSTKLYRYASIQDAMNCENDQTAELKLRIENRACGIDSKLNAGEKAIFVVREQYTRQKVIDLMDACCPRQVSLLRAAAAISKPFADQLQLINEIRRKIERMKREQKHLSATRRKLQSLAETRVSQLDQMDDQNQSATVHSSDTFEQHLASLDRLENNIASILDKSDILAAKLVDIELEEQKKRKDLEHFSISDTSTGTNHLTE